MLYPHFTGLYLMQILKKQRKAGVGLPACEPLCVPASRVSTASWLRPAALRPHLGPLVASARLLPSLALFSQLCRQWCHFPVAASSLPPSPALTSLTVFCCLPGSSNRHIWFGSFLDILAHWHMPRGKQMTPIKDGSLTRLTWPHLSNQCAECVQWKSAESKCGKI